MSSPTITGMDNWNQLAATQFIAQRSQCLCISCRKRRAGAAVWGFDGEGNAEELLMTLTKQAVAEPTSLNLAVQILLKDYIERAKQEKRESDVISGR
jgi:hypothetical protein